MLSMELELQCKHMKCFMIQRTLTGVCTSNSAKIGQHLMTPLKGSQGILVENNGARGMKRGGLQTRIMTFHSCTKALLCIGIWSLMSRLYSEPAMPLKLWNCLPVGAQEIKCLCHMHGFYESGSNSLALQRHYQPSWTQVEPVP
ncbi:uncharacterized protein LOC109283277 isoform X2 [Alligator mississippiensis]|uniref:uncharacterized protein LOC109283277 isoform X2 n=1 Tax=Alligator mississippiensis TaxID=8496 RepID=UPI0028777335|nr:uncharacterized protein LOC109283277 isoform X2 [Alligator mississippiensis]